jgi:hypothetical protein
MKARTIIKRSVSKFYISPEFSSTAYLEVKRDHIMIYRKAGDVGSDSLNELESWGRSFPLIETSEKIAKKNLLLGRFTRH